MAGATLLQTAPAKARSAGRECACCEIDWCITSCVSRTGLAKCDCHAYLSSKGYKVPLDAPAAVAAVAGETDWFDLLGWKGAKLPRWAPVDREGVDVKESTLEGAGRGLFACKALPKWSVLPPYRGTLLTPGDLARRRYTPQMDYVWCPGRRQPLLNMSDEDLSASRALTYCVDARGASEATSPAKYVNAANSASQCGAVNVEVCEFGQVAYFRTTQEVPAGSELLTEYGDYYWEGFRGC